MNKFFAWINSGTTAQQNKKRLTCYMIVIVAALLVISILTLAVIGIVSAVKKGNDPDEEQTVDPNRGFVTTTLEQNQLHKGNLLIVDELHPYIAEANADIETKKFSEVRTSIDGENIYFAYNQYIDVNADAMEALDKMIVDFYNTAKGKDGNLYKDSNIYISNIDYGNTFEFKYYATIKGQNGAEATTYAKISENEKYEWIFDNAYKYGFVQLYSAPEASTAESAEATEDMTHIFRYIGNVHAQLMKDKKCETLAEYIELLRSTSYKKTFGVSVDKVSYKVYYIPQGETPMVPESYSYTVSGNNVDGYIVTYSTVKNK